VLTVNVQIDSISRFAARTSTRNGAAGTSSIPRALDLLLGALKVWSQSVSVQHNAQQCGNTTVERYLADQLDRWSRRAHLPPSLQPRSGISPRPQNRGMLYWSRLLRWPSRWRPRSPISMPTYLGYREHTVNCQYPESSPPKRKRPPGCTRDDLLKRRGARPALRWLCRWVPSGRGSAISGASPATVTRLCLTAKPRFSFPNCQNGSCFAKGA